MPPSFPWSRMIEDPILIGILNKGIELADKTGVLDRDFRSTYVSPSIERVLGFTPKERKRQELDEMVTPGSLQRIMEKFKQDLQGDERQDADPDRSVIIDVEYYHANGSTVWMENNVKAMRDQTGSIIGIYGVSRDVTEARQAQEALVLERDRLQEALGKVKKLSGLLPICASCKKIRNDQGYWSQIESYIRDHSEAQFSHGICPECAKLLYSDLDIFH